jgi:hypothetical protein
MTGARRARRGWFRKNAAALAALVVAVPLAGWWTTRSDYKSWYAAEPRDPVVVAAGGTSYAGATWYAASVEVDPPARAGRSTEPTPPGTTRVRVYFRLQVDDVVALEGLGGCRPQLRAPDGRLWNDSAAEGDFQDRPTGCTGGYDSAPQSWRGATAQHYLKPVAGKPFETGAVFVVPSAVASSVEPTLTWATRLPQYLVFPR